MVVSKLWAKMGMPCFYVNCVLTVLTSLTLSAMGGARPSILWGGVNLTHTFHQLPGAYWAIILSILIIILFKERINDFLEKKLGQ